MNTIEKMLKQGDLRTIGRTDEVIKMVLDKPELFETLVNAMLTDDKGIRMRAADAVEKISLEHPTWLAPHKKLILTKITKINQQEVRWHMAQVMPRLTLTSAERKRLFDILISYLDDKSRIVKTFSMQALADIALQDHSYLPKVKRIITRLTQEGSPAMQSRGKKLLSMLNK